MGNPAIQELLDVGAHFGHMSQKWNPRMKPFILQKRNGIHVINVEQTAVYLTRSLDKVREVAARGGTILFVGTKKQARKPITETAQELGMPYVSERWLGGMLTNNRTIRRSVAKLENILTREEDGSIKDMTKKELSVMMKEKTRLLKNLLGIKEMNRLPELIFIIDPNHEVNAVGEARKLGIPIIAMVDTNCNPEPIDYIIPCNDDAMRSIQYVLGHLKTAILEGREVWKQKEAERQAREAEQKAEEESRKAEQRKKADEIRKAREAEAVEEKAKAEQLISDLEQKPN